MVKAINFLYLMPVLFLPLTANAKPTPDLFDFLVNGSETLTLHCSLNGNTFNKHCKIEATYIGSTMGDALTVYFPNGKRANYRIDDYEKKTLVGLNDDKATYQLTSTTTTLAIYRNQQPWIKLWKTKK